MQTYLTPKITNNEKEALIDCLDAAHALFSLPEEEKAKAKMRPGINRGWDKSYQDHTEQNEQTEAFLFGEQCPTNSAKNNIWPSALECRHLESLKQLIPLSKKLIMQTLSIYDTTLTELLKRSQIDDLRAKLSFYSSPLMFNETDTNIVCDSHTDFGLVTLNVSSDTKWIETSLGGKGWRRVMEPPYKPIIWYGDQAMQIPDATLKPCNHRISFSKDCDSTQRVGLSVFLDIK